MDPRARHQIFAALLRAGRPDLANAILHLTIARMSIEQALEAMGLDQVPEPGKLKELFRKLALLHHPDRGGDLAKMQQLNQAYDVLVQVRPMVPGPTQDEKAAQEQRYEQVGQTILATLDRLFRPDVFTRYFEELVGQKFTVEVKTVPRERYRNYCSRSGVWTSADRETVFTVALTVDVTNATFSRALGPGGDDVTFTMWIDQTQLHQNRKSKFKRRDWDSSNRASTLLDPKVLFPPDKIQKMLGGKESARKFSRRDMLLALERKLNVHLWTSGRDLHGYLPLGPDGQWTLVIHRLTMMNQPSWAATSLSRGRPGLRTSRQLTRTYQPFPEAESTIRALHDLQRKLANAQQDQEVERAVTRTLHDLQEAWRAEKSSPG